MSKERKLIPELRFPEFFNDGEWQEQRLVKLANRVLKKNKDGAINSVFTNSAVQGIVDQREFFDKDIANKSNLENYYIVEDGDYVYNPRISKEAPVGPISKNNTGRIGVMSPLYTVFRFKNNENQFYEYYFISKHWYNAIRKASNTGARFDRMSITDSVFMGIPVLFPQPLEQQKIASCLSSLDELLATHSDKLKALKAHKKGLMQNLFPQEGQKEPNYRFSEFTDPLKQVGFATLGSIKIGLTHKPDYIKSGIPFLSSKNISNGYIDFKDIKYISQEKFDSMPESTKPKVGDILFTRVGSNLGNPIILEENKIFGIFVSLGFFRVNKKSHNRYIKYWMESDYFWKQVNQKVAGGAKNNLNSSWLKEFELFLPSVSEQEKIASCLSALNKLINAQADKIEQLQQHKKGLMQGLFPKIES